MRISEQWLREFVSLEKTTQAISDQLTMAGLEVEAVESLGGNFSGVVVARIDAIEQHPNAEKLRLCQVFDGSETVPVVCAAPNARQGLVAAFAKVGAKLPELTIKKARLRGIDSCGMLCGAPELALGDDDSGLLELPADAPLGLALEEYLQLDDNIIELDLTPNRADCFSILGIARDISAVNGVTFTEPTVAAIAATGNVKHPVQRLDAACPRYVSRIINNININHPSPLWLQEKLRRAGLRCIDAVVDITNLVMLEYGQPMHAFDLDTVQGDIQVRMAQAGESIKLLNDQTVTLTPDTLLIADATGPLAIAGIMGGKRTAVTAATRNILLESAFFQPLAIAGKARSYGLHTDSSLRFERGVDFSKQERAIERATALLLAVVGGEPQPTAVSETAEQLPALAAINLRRSRIQQLTGLTLSNERVEAILNGLGCQLTGSDNGWRVKTTQLAL